jgi:DNA-binding Xre family transcriptional regulator
VEFKVISNLSHIMIDKGVKSNSKLAELSGVSRPTIIKMEKGEFDTIQFRNILRVCGALGCTIEELVIMKPVAVEVNEVAELKE